MIPTTLRTSVFSVHGINYEVTGPDDYRVYDESEGIYHYRSDNLDFEEKLGDLTVNGKKFGSVKPGDTVKIASDGTVFINDTLQTPQ